MYSATHADGIPLNTSTNKQSSAVAIGTAPNVYGAGFGPKSNLVANEDLNTIAFIHRSDYNSNGDYSSGSLRFDYSTDGGSLGLQMQAHFGTLTNQVTYTQALLGTHGLGF